MYMKMFEQLLDGYGTIVHRGRMVKILDCCFTVYMCIVACAIATGLWLSSLAFCGLCGNYWKLCLHAVFALSVPFFMPAMKLKQLQLWFPVLLC